MTKDTGRRGGPTEEFTPIWGPHLPSAKAAKSVGAKYFFTGKPCKRGHVEPRYAHGSCTACKAEDRIANRDEHIIYLREWRKANPDKTSFYHEKQSKAGYHKEYYEKNKDEILARDAAWRAENPDAAKQIQKRSYEKHREKRRAKARDKYAEDPTYDKERAVGYRRSNRKKLAEQSKQWRKDNPELVRTYDRNKKIKRRGAEGRHTQADVASVMERQKFKCAECSASVRNSYHVDHIMPLSKGGTNWPSNLQILCPACNMEKHATDPIEWARRKGRLV